MLMSKCIKYFVIKKNTSLIAINYLIVKITRWESTPKEVYVSILIFNSRISENSLANLYNGFLPKLIQRSSISRSGSLRVLDAHFSIQTMITSFRHVQYLSL